MTETDLTPIPGNKWLDEDGGGTLTRAEHEEIVRQYMPLVCRIARRYSRYNPGALEDLVQVGSIGLLKAVKYYDPRRARSASFKTLAVCYIRGEIRHYLRDYCSIVQVPRRLTEINFQLAQLEEKLTRELDRSPTVRELSEASGYSITDIQEAQQCWDVRYHYESFESSGDDEEREEKRCLAETVADRKYQDRVYLWEDREALVQALKRLGERAREIVEFVFFYDLSEKKLLRSWV